MMKKSVSTQTPTNSHAITTGRRHKCPLFIPALTWLLHLTSAQTLFIPALTWLLHLTSAQTLFIPALTWLSVKSYLYLVNAATPQYCLPTQCCPHSN